MSRMEVSFPFVYLLPSSRNVVSSGGTIVAVVVVVASTGAAPVYDV
jgi:hypothetical protein